MKAIQTSDGSNVGQFQLQDWVLLISVAAIWGSSFLWIAIGLGRYDPGAIAFLRVLLGAAALWAFAPARRPVARSAWPGITVVAIAGNAVPAVFFALAQQRVESSVAGMINSLAPFAVLFVAVAMTRKAPARMQVIGLGVGLVGAALMSSPNIWGANAQPLGVLLAFMAVVGYAISNNVTPPLQQAYGGPAIIARALLVSTVVLLPYGVFGLARSELKPGPTLAIVILGVAGTGAARALFATLIGRVGAPRSSVMGYIVPVFAILLGVLVRNERLHPLEALGTAVILLGAWIISRRPR